MVSTNVVHQRTRPSIRSLEDRAGFALAIAVLPVVLTGIVIGAHSIVTGTPSGAYGLPIAYLVYGLSNVVAVGSLYYFLSDDERESVFRFTRPSLTEIGWAVGAFVIGLGVYQFTSRVATAFGYELQGLSYSLTTPTTVAMVVVGTVIIGPITEEILYRGLVLGTLLARGVGVVSAVILMTGIFAVIHLPNFGVAGTLFISVWAPLPALLRLRFNNLSGAVLMHMLNNIFTYLVVVGLGWA